jgi:hypothetical protein
MLKPLNDAFMGFRGLDSYTANWTVKMNIDETKFSRSDEANKAWFEYADNSVATFTESVVFEKHRKVLLMKLDFNIKITDLDESKANEGKEPKRPLAGTAYLSYNYTDLNKPLCSFAVRFNNLPEVFSRNLPTSLTDDLEIAGIFDKKIAQYYFTADFSTNPYVKNYFNTLSTRPSFFDFLSSFKYDLEQPNVYGKNFTDSDMKTAYKAITEILGVAVDPAWLEEFYSTFELTNTHFTTTVTGNSVVDNTGAMLGSNDINVSGLLDINKFMNRILNIPSGQLGILPFTLNFNCVYSNHNAVPTFYYPIISQNNSYDISILKTRQLWADTFKPLPISPEFEQIEVYIDGEKIYFHPSLLPRIVDDRVMVPVRIVGQAIGAAVSSTLDENGGVETAVYYKNYNATITKDSLTLISMGTTVELPKTAMIIDDAFFVPIWFFVDGFGQKLDTKITETPNGNHFVLNLSSE